MQKYKLLLLILLISDITNAQDALIDFKNQMNTIFANVDHSRIPTGLFSDYGL